MKKAIIILPFLLFSTLTLFSILGRIRFGYGLGDIIYYPFIYLGNILSIINIFYFRNKQSNGTYISFSCLAIFFTLIFLQMTIWRGPEYSWNGDIITPSITTKEKRKAKKFEHRLEEYNNKIIEDLENYELLIKKGVFLRSNGRYKEAITTFKKAQSLDPKKYKAYWEAGYAYSLLKDYKNAVIEYEIAFEIDTSNIRLRKSIEFLKNKHNID